MEEGCFVFSPREHRLARGRSGTAAPQRTTLNNVCDRGCVDQSCTRLLCSPAALYTAAWCVTLGIYAGTDDVCTNIDVRGDVGDSDDKSRSEFRLRAVLNSEEPAEALVRRLHQDSVVSAPTTTSKSYSSNGDSSNSSSLFCDTALSLSSRGIEEEELDGPLLRGWIHDDGSSLTVGIVYLSELWTSTQAIWFAQLLSNTIVQLANHEQCVLRNIDFVPPAQLKTVSSWNSRNFPDDCCNTCIHQAISDQVTVAPDALAVCAWDGDFTYHQLEKLASRLAWQLHLKGVAPGQIVPFWFRSSKWRVVALLAILRAGGAAVALDVDVPMERFSFILHFTAARVILVGRDVQQSQHMRDCTEVEKIFVDTELSEDEIPQHDKFASSAIQPSDAAYIQFTSGSTGQPKGVTIEHRTFLANAFSQHRDCRISRSSRVLHLASPSFDSILTEVLVTLLTGACICVPSEDGRYDVAEAIRSLNVDWLGTTPTVARILHPCDVPDLKTLVVWGEAATSEFIERWSQNESVQLMILYGPSENSGVTTFRPCARAAEDFDPSLVGRGIIATNTWLVRTNNRKQLAPLGAVGEIVLQGPSVARGYLHDADRTAASFMHGAPWLEPSAKPLHQRIYYTGDLARYRPDGTLQLLGRIDSQVKIRGRRVELAEIERHINTYLSQISSLRGFDRTTSIVEMFAPAANPDHKSLAAFVVHPEQRVYCSSHGQGSRSESGIEEVFCQASNSFKATLVALDEYLSSRLPPYSRPTFYIPIQFLPQSAAGKADRRRLRSLAASLSISNLEMYLLATTTATSATTEAPTTAAQWLMIELWAEVLGVRKENITLDSNFLHFGDSVLAMRLAVAARKRGILLTVPQLLRTPRLRDLAAVIASSTEGNPASTSVQPPYAAYSTIVEDAGGAVETLRTLAAREAQMPLAEIEDVARATDYQCMYLAWSCLSQRAGTNYITLDFSNALDPQQLQSAAEKLVSYHPVLRTVFFVHQRCMYQAVLKHMTYDIIHCLGTFDIAKATSSIIQSDMMHPLKIGSPLIKFWLLRDADGGLVHRLVLRASHVQYDGVTIIRWLRELSLCYSNDKAALYPITSFPGYMHFNSNHNQDSARTFWRKLLAGSSMTEIFKHTSPPYRNVINGKAETLVDRASLRPSEGITPATTVKTAWALVLAEMAGSEDVVFGSVVWGRNAPYAGVEHVAGICIDNIPVRVRLQSGITSRLELLREVQDQYFGATEFEAFQYRRIVEQCTEWSSWQRLSTLVEYDNLDEDITSFNIISDDGSKTSSFTIDEIRPPGDFHDVTIYCMPVGDQISVQLEFCKSLIPQTVGQRMLDRMIEHIATFSNDIHSVVVLQQHDSISLPRIPLALPSPLDISQHEGYNRRDTREEITYEAAVIDQHNGDAPPRTPIATAGPQDGLTRTNGELFGAPHHILDGGNQSLKSEANIDQHSHDVHSSGQSNGFLPPDIDSVYADVEEVWSDVLGSSPAQIAIYRAERTPWFAVWGSYIAAVAMADRFKEKGFRVAMEDFLDWGDVDSQIALLRERRQTSHDSDLV